MYKFIDKTLFFPEKGILVIGDMHIGYENMLIKSGVLTPKTRLQEIIDELTNLILEIKEKSNLNKIIFIGDIKHSFKFEFSEKINFQEVVEVLKQQVKEIIFIKGNHDTIDYSYEDQLKDFYIEDDIIFLHGHKTFPEIEKAKTIVMGHIHPSIIFHDTHTSKSEKYKCFLVGKSNKKEVIILPSFLDISIGSPINNYDEYNDKFSIIPKKDILKFKVFVIGKDKTYEFKKVKDLLNA